jgi:hypothetical protein
VVLLPLPKIDSIMEKKTFEEVTSQAIMCLKNRLLRADGTLKYYNYHGRRLTIKVKKQHGVILIIHYDTILR